MTGPRIDGFESGTIDRPWRLDVRSKLDREPTPGGVTRRRIPRGRAMAVVVALGVLATLIVGSVQLQLGTDKNSERARVSYTTHAPIIIMDDSEFTFANGVTGGTGTASDPFIISGWDISTDMFGVCVMIGLTNAHFIVRNCHVHAPTAICIEIFSAPHGDVENCLVDNGDMGIALYDSSDSNVTGNVVTNQDSGGIIVLLSRWVNVSGNQATQDNMTAIMCSEVSNVSLVDNIASNDNYTGIMIDNATDIQVIGNNASGSGNNGLQINNTMNVVVQGNNLTSNLGCGVWLGNSTYVLIFHNNFIANPVNAYQETSSLIRWNETYPTGGNHWSDYSGKDLKSGPLQSLPGPDGIGDTVYLVAPPSYRDYYPLMNETTGPIIPEFNGALVPIVGLTLLCGALVRSNGRKKK